MICYAVRHGETDWNKEKLLQGWHDIPLNENGLRQAEETRDKLLGVPFEAIYSSPLSRAKETAEIIAAPHHLNVITDDRLRERHFGQWEGAKWGSYKWEDVWAYDANVTCEGERVKPFLDRVFSFFDEIRDRHKGPVLVVSHGGTMRAVECYFNGIDQTTLHHRILDNGEVRIFERFNHEPIRIGNCVKSAERAAMAYEAGFEYVELPMKDVMALSDKEVESMIEEFRAVPIPVEAFNAFFPPTVTLYGDEKNHEAVMNYVRRAIRIAARFGAKCVVVGSGGSRNVPETMTTEEAMTRFGDLIRDIARIAEPENIVVTPEPLSYAETNLLNTLREAIELDRKIELPNVGCMVDFYHFHANKEDLSDFRWLRPGELKHAHVAAPVRFQPGDGDREILTLWAETLKKADYHGRLSLECRWTDHTAENYRAARKALEVFTR